MRVGTCFCEFSCFCSVGGCSLSPTSTPTATPGTVIPSATPTPAAITYRLINGYSVLFVYSETNSQQVLLTSDLLSGTFVAAPSGLVTDGRPAYFTISDTAFDGYPITGGRGEIAILHTGGQVAMAATLSINGESVELNGEVPLSVLSDDFPPTFNGLQACGAPGRTVTCDELETGGVTGYDLRLWAAPEATQTPLPTRTPTPTLVVTYDLTDGSTILAAVPTPGSSPIVEPLSGTFVMQVNCTDPGQCIEQVHEGNDLFNASIVSIAFQSPQFTVTGTGYVDLTTLDYPNYYVGATVFINGQAVGMNGGGRFDVASYPPTFGNLQLCGGAVDRAVLCDAIQNGTDSGFILTIFAKPRR